MSVPAASARAVVGVVGLGGVGLPLADAFVAAGHAVVGYDIDAAKVQALAAGRDVLRYHDLAGRLRASGRFEAVHDAERLGACAAVAVCVPTPLDASGKLDTRPLLASAALLAGVLRKGALVVLESTVPPGTTRRLYAQELAARGRADLLVAYSPEREDPGSGRSLAQVPKLVSGTTDEARAAALALYRGVFASPVETADCETAEAAKLYENAYRSVNIALANEFAAFCAKAGLDVRAVLDAAATKPFGFQRFEPGPGVGGHCIPKDARLLADAARAAGAPTTLLEQAARIHDERPRAVVEECFAALRARGAGARPEVLVLGVAYKRDVDVTTNAPALVVARELAQGGATVRWHDPVLGAQARLDDHEGRALPRIEALDREVLARHDLVLVLADHASIDWELVASAARAVVDTRGVLRRLRP